MDDNFNSSDIEFPEEVDRYTHYGAQSVQSMLNNTFDNRIDSKRQSKQLKNIAHAPGVQKQEALWRNRFRAFRLSVLQQDISVTPVGADIERFLYVVVDHIKARTSTAPGEHALVPSYKGLKSGLSNLLYDLKFDDDQFKLSSHERIRIATVFKDLLRKGKLTKDPSREKQWLGVFYVEKMASAFYEDTLVHGTPSWDVIIGKALSLLLNSALSTRSGDTSVSAGYTEGLLLRDVKVKLIRTDNVEMWRALITLRNEKGSKGVESRKIEIASLNEPIYNKLCPIALLLALALRIEAVETRSIDDLILSTRQRQDKTVQWARPDWPVLHKLMWNGSGLVVGTPASSGQVLRIVKSLALLAGIAAHVNAHDLRRGAARDLALVDVVHKGVAKAATGKALGHSKKARDRGVTDAYIGHNETDTWLPRLKQRTAADAFGITLKTPYKKAKRTSQFAITEYCKANNLNPNEKKSRQRASTAIRAAELQEWRHNQADSVDPDITAIEDEDQTLVDDYDEQTLMDDDDERTMVEESGEVTEFLNFNHCDPMEDYIKSETLHLPHTELIRFFSQINTVRRNGGNPGSQFPSASTGGSRSAPTYHLFQCPNEEFGCEHSSQIPLNLTLHVETCWITFTGAKEQREAAGFKCTKDGCGFSSVSANGLRKHVYTEHTEGSKQPNAKKSCPHGCHENQLMSRDVLRTHMEKDHGTWEHRRCPFPGCTFPRIYDTSAGLRTHMRSHHQVRDAKLIRGYCGEYDAAAE